MSEMAVYTLQNPQRMANPTCPANELASAERTIGAALPARDIVSVAPYDNVRLAAVRMAEGNCGSALVLSGGRTVVGIITERDIIVRIVAKSLDPSTTRVESVMTHRPVCAPPEMLVPHALYTMRELGFRHFPVVDSAYVPVGVFSLRDAFPEELLEATYLADVRAKITKTVD